MKLWEKIKGYDRSCILFGSPFVFAYWFIGFVVEHHKQRLIAEQIVPALSHTENIVHNAYWVMGGVPQTILLASLWLLIPWLDEIGGNEGRYRPGTFMLLVVLFFILALPECTIAAGGYGVLPAGIIAFAFALPIMHVIFAIIGAWEKATSRMQKVQPE